MSDIQPGLLDVLFEVGRQRQQILSNLRKAYEAKDLDSILQNVEQLVGLDERLEGQREKSH